MNKYKILIGINIFLLLSLVVCLSFLIKKDPVKETVIELLDGMIKETKEGFSEQFLHYGMLLSIKEKIDTFYGETNAFYHLMNPEFSCTPQLITDYYDKMASNDSTGETKIIFNTLRSIKNKQSQDFTLMSKLIEYNFLKKARESAYLSFFWFDDVRVKILYKKDTIRLGEENIVEFGLFGHISAQFPTLVIDGDTVEDFYIFKEKPQKRGLVVHEGHISCFHPSEGIVEFPFKYSYYVK
ncbi:MAG: hypothetical protein FWH36_00365 [Lentimicrobiaceae bacterium]|nr:hypothetical protein [Lentimicrobiaceae bacterium]